MELEPVIVFDSTVLVLWAVAVVPYLLKEKRWSLLIASGTALLMIDIRLSWHLFDVPMNVITSIGVLCLALLGGCIQHHFNQKEQREAHDANSNQ